MLTITDKYGDHDYHIGQTLKADVDTVKEIFADGDEKQVIEDFIKGIPTCTVVGVRSFYWYGDIAKSIAAFLQSYGENIVKLGDIGGGRNAFMVKSFAKR